MMKLLFNYLFFALLVLFTTCCNDVQTSVLKKNERPDFARRGKVVSANFVGTVWLNYLAENDSTFNVNVGSVICAPGARTNWFYHIGGQILLVTDVKGLYQEKGKP